MKKMTSIGAVLFSNRDNPMYLLLHYETGHWGFPKGGVEENETEEETLRREIQEETGITNIALLDGFKEKIRYFYQFREQTVDKQVIFFLAETNETRIQLSAEHIDFRWLSFDDALAQLTFDNSKELLKKADKFLKTLN